MADDVQGALGGFAVFGIIALVITIVVGGVFRTEVTYVPDGVQATDTVEFKDTATARHFLGGLIKGGQPDLQKILSKYKREGEQVTRLTIITKHTWLDNFIMVVTFFIYCPETVVVKGAMAKVPVTSPVGI